MADPLAERMSQIEQLANQSQSEGLSREEQIKRMADTGVLSQMQGQNAPPSEVSATPQLGFQNLYGRRDEQGQPVPIDTQSGFMAGSPLEDQDTGLAPVGRYWRLSQQSDPEAQAQVLQKMYPDKKVRILDSGDVTLEVIDGKTGKPKDLVLNPTGLDAHDLFDLASQAPEIGAQIAAAIATRGRGSLKTAAQMVVSALTGSTVGASRDIMTRSFEGIPVRGEDIKRDRTAQAIMSIAGEGVLGGLGKASRAFSPFAREVKPGSLAFDMRQGLQSLREGYNVDLATSPGERTGSKMLMAVESAEGPMPGSRNVVDATREERNKALQQVQRIATQGLKPDEEIGREAQEQLLWRVVQPLEQGFQQARREALERGNQRALRLIDDIAGPSGITKTEAGTVGQQAYARRLTRAEEAVDTAYARVNALPGGSGDVLPGDAAAQAAEDIRSQLPGVVNEVERPTVLSDSGGRPMTRTVEERAALRGNEPAGLEAALRDMEALRGGRVSLQTLTELKNRAHDAIAAFRTAHGDAKDRWFSRIAQGFEDTIQAGIDSTGDLELRNALVNARNTYRRELLPLERPGLRELAKDEMDAGRLSGEQVVDHFLEGPKAIQNLSMLTEVLGEGNVAMRAMRRAWLDVKIGKLTDSVTRLVDPEKLGDIIQNMQAERPELARFMFGRNANELQNTLRFQEAIARVGGKQGIKSIDENELRTLLSMPSPSVQDFRDVMRLGARRDAVYLNKVYDDVRQGALTQDWQPTRFVKAIRNTNPETGLSTDQLRETLSNLDPRTRDAVATAEFYRILNAASKIEGETLAQRAAGEPINLSPSRLVEALGKNAAERERTALLLADDLSSPGSNPPRIATGGQPQETGLNRSQTLLALVKTLAPKEAASTVFSGLGSISSATAIREMTRGPLKYTTGFVKNWLIATAYMGKLGERLTNRVWDEEGSALLANTLIASEPFMRASVDAFGPDVTKEMTALAKDSIDRFIFEINDSPEGRKRQAAKQFTRGQQVPMKMEAR